jgi:hypothetical protein
MKESQKVLEKVASVFGWLWRGIVVVISGFTFGIMGWLVGALIGGNFAEGFALSGVRGYEATGLVGFHLGVAIGATLSWRILAKLHKLA